MTASTSRRCRSTVPWGELVLQHWGQEMGATAELWEEGRGAQATRLSGLTPPCSSAPLSHGQLHFSSSQLAYVPVPTAYCAVPGPACHPIPPQSPSGVSLGHALPGPLGRAAFPSPFFLLMIA